MDFSVGNLVKSVVGAVAKVAIAVVNKLSPVAKSGGILGGIAGAIVGVAEAVLGVTAEFANACEDGEIDDEEAEELLEDVFKLLVGAFIGMFGSDSSHCDSKEEKSTIPNSTGAAFRKSWNSIKEIGHDFWSEVDSRGQKAFNSGYDFANWLGCGVPDIVMETLKSNAERSEKAFDSFYDFSNWISFGSVDMVNETFNPKDPLSKEHWLNSFGTASAIFGIKGTKSTMSSKGGFGVKEEIGVANKGISNSGISRGEYLRNKFGKISSEDLNNYINLKQEIKDYIGTNSKGLKKSKTNMVSKVCDTSKQGVSDGYLGLSGKKNMNKFLDSLQSPKDPMYLHQDIIKGIRELAEKKGIEINEEALMNANKGYLTNANREYLNTVLNDISQRPWNVLNCGDIRAVNEALIKGANKSDLIGASYNIGKQQFEKRCPNCQVTTKGVKWYIK